MRYIAIRDLQPDATWIKAASDAANLIRRAQPDERSKLISDYQSVWKDLKEKLRSLSNGKCWYCESIDPRSDNAVDHYRPKGNVREANPPHGGYWWLAFDWTNYRFSCTYCNSIRTSATTTGGKQDYFPIWDESRRARTDADDIDDELPLLLDPTRVTDVRLIAFTEDGSVGPAVEEEQEREYKMASESITRYHLQHPILVERRALTLRAVGKSIADADKQLARYVTTKNVIARSTAEAFLRQVRDAASPRAEYSIAVKHLLAGLAAKSDAARSVLDSL
jgi:uncharacterized protein (TIGR02646 family)